MDWEASGSLALDARLAGWRVRDEEHGPYVVARAVARAAAVAVGAGVGRRNTAPESVPSRCGLHFPGMLYAAVAAVAALSDADLASARQQAGIIQVLSIAAPSPDIPDALTGAAAVLPAVAVVARGAALARKGLAGLVPGLNSGSGSGPGSGSGAGSGMGPGKTAAAGAATAIDASAERCAAQWRNGELRLWLPTRDVARYRAAAAQLADLPERRVEVCTAGLGSESGIASGIVAAVALARALTPVPVLVTRY